MPTYIVDPTKFHAEGAVVNWDTAARRVGRTQDNPLGSNIQLRWMLRADLGLPTEPFLVWTRLHTANSGFIPLTFFTQGIAFALSEVVHWNEGPMSSLSLNVTSASGGVIVAFAGSFTTETIVGMRVVAAGNTTLEISGSMISCLTMSQGITINSMTGMAPGGYANAPGWTLVEVVGLPVAKSAWGDVGKYGEPQGLTGSLSDAPTAAVARLLRGAPPTGWGPNIAAGVPAPAWSAPDLKALVIEVNHDLLQYLHDIAKSAAPKDQAGSGVTVALPPPENSSGLSTNKPGTTTQMFPLPMTYMAASTDPFLSLALGFGTAYPFTSRPTLVAVGANQQPHDFMITAHWERGFDGASGPVDLAVIIPAPIAALAPMTPANMATQALGALRPLAINGDWRESVRLTWDRPSANQLLRTASCAAARAGLHPAAAAVALMSKRTSGGYRPIVLGAVLDPPEQQDPEPGRVNVMDREIDIPFNPGSLAIRYGAATQDIYGQWSPWVATDTTITQTDLEPVRLSNPKLTPVAPASGSACATTLEVEFTWDWRIRSPQTVTILGRMYAAATHGTPPPNTTIPGGLDRTLSGGGGALVISFTGDTPSATGVTITPLSEDGEHVVKSFGAAQGTNRRYRVAVTGLSLDFASTGFIGIALWAAGKESIAPQRTTPGSDAQPLVTSTGDPRPPVVPVFQVTLGSIPDATGSSHVQIAWTKQLNAAGYFVYEATEANLLDAWGLPEPSQKATLTARLAVIRAHFKTNPIRRPFTRWNATALTTTGTDIALPKGSKGIHVFVVLGVSAGQIESLWPSGPSPENSLIAIAAPHITKPQPPMIEVQQFLDSSVSPAVYKARLVVTTRPGPRPAMVELYRVRVDDAAKELDTMGPPLVRLKSTSAPWTVSTITDPDYGPYVTTVSGVDAPAGSWRRVWYRATAWTGQDNTRGGLPGRSEASNAAWVVLPPATGPTVSALTVTPGPGPADLIVSWTSDAQVKRTPLGPHKISVRASVVGAVPPAAALIALDSTLDALTLTQPASGSGVWIVSTVSGVTTYAALVHRAASTDMVNFAVRITDPLGRSGSQTMTMPVASVVAAPDLQGLLLKTLPLPPPARVVLTFHSSSPIVAPPSGPYVLKVTGVIGKVLGKPPVAPTLTMALGNVPTKLKIGVPPVIYVLRSGAAPSFTYTVVTTAAVKGFTVRITGPDGTFVEKSA